MNQIVIADITTLKWRGLVSGLIYSPFIINAFIGSLISASVLENSTWRWGCRLSFSSKQVFVELSLPNRWHVCDLASGHSCSSRCDPSPRRAESQEARIDYPDPPLGYVTAYCRFPLAIYATLDGKSVPQKVMVFAEQLDLVGLVLLGAAATLILLPITLVKTTSQWSDG